MASPKDSASKTESGGGSLTMPDLIPDTPENIAKALLSQPPRKRSEWKFMQGRDEPDAEE